MSCCLQVAHHIHICKLTTVLRYFVVAVTVAFVFSSALAPAETALVAEPVAFATAAVATADVFIAAVALTAVAAAIVPAVVILLQLLLLLLLFLLL